MSSEELQSMEIDELRNRLQTTIKREGMEGKLRAQLRSWLVRKMENEDDSVRRNRFGPKKLNVIWKENDWMLRRRRERKRRS